MSRPQGVIAQQRAGCTRRPHACDRRLVWRCMLVLGLAGCPTHNAPVTVTVRSPDTQPVTGATVGWVCEPSGDGAAVSDARGAATVTVFNSSPETCTLTVAKIGFRTQQLEAVKLESRDITLEPSP